MKIINKTKIIGLKEFRQNANTFIERVNKGESFTVFKRSNPVFKITPIEDEEMWETVADFTEIQSEGISAEDFIKALRKVNG